MCTFLNSREVKSLYIPQLCELHKDVRDIFYLSPRLPSLPVRPPPTFLSFFMLTFQKMYIVYNKPDKAFEVQSEEKVETDLNENTPVVSLPN